MNGLIPGGYRPFIYLTLTAWIALHFLVMNERPHPARAKHVCRPSPSPLLPLSSPPHPHPQTAGSGTLPPPADFDGMRSI